MKVALTTSFGSTTPLFIWKLSILILHNAAYGNVHRLFFGLIFMSALRLCEGDGWKNPSVRQSCCAQTHSSSSSFSLAVSFCQLSHTHPDMHITRTKTSVQFNRHNNLTFQLHSLITEQNLVFADCLQYKYIRSNTISLPCSNILP